MNQKATNEKQYVSDVWVNAFWTPFETLAAQTRKQAGQWEEGMWNAWGETRKWANDQRQQVETFLQQEVKKSNDLFFQDHQALKHVFEQAEAIVATPVKFANDLFEKVEQAIVERQNDFITTQRDQVSSFWKLQEELTSTVKANQISFFRLVEDNVSSVFRA